VRLESGGNGRVNTHWRVELDDGRSAFVKQALTAEAAKWLRAERHVYENVHGSFLPAYFGAEDTLLVIEDLSAAEWPPPWTHGRIDLVLESVLSPSRSPASSPRVQACRRRRARRPCVSFSSGSSRWRSRGPRASSGRLRPDGEPSQKRDASSCGLESGRPLDERRREADASRTESQRAATEQAGPQAVAELGPLVIVPLHAI
jgi:hypothetical protein